LRAVADARVALEQVKKLSDGEPFARGGYDVYLMVKEALVALTKVLHG